MHNESAMGSMRRMRSSTAFVRRRRALVSWRCDSNDRND